MSRLLLLLACSIAVMGAAAAPATFGPSAYPFLPDDSLFSTVFWDQTASNDYKALNFGYAVQGTDSVALARVATTTALQDGWHALYVKVEDSTLKAAAADERLMNATYYAAGYAEGYATSELIYYSWYNQLVGETIANLSTDAMEWIDTHLAFMRQNVAAKGGVTGTDAYWAQVGKILVQIEGITDGYNKAQSLLATPKPLDFLNIFMLSFIDETGDVERSAYILKGRPIPADVQERLKRVGEHCSAFVKLVADDIFVAHATWSGLGGMLRTFKTYHFGTTVMQISSYPGDLASDDDFYYFNNGLVAQETTNHNHNNSNTAGTQPYSVSEFIRALVSGYLAQGNPATWATTFCQENSGTYNNQYMVVQLGGFTKGTGQMAASSFWVAEQMPGACIAQDQTDHLNTNSYWASYNRPFYPEIFEGMNWTSMEKLSPYYSYANNYRALIFAREQSKIATLEDMKTLMRYNDYKHDEYSIVPDCPECWPQRTPYLSIAARCDLVPANGSFGVLNGEISLQNEAAIDAKIISLSLFKNRMQATIASGPPFGGPSDIPAFKFSTTLVTPRPRNMGLPDELKYNYTNSNGLYNNAPAAIPDFTQTGDVRVTLSVLVSAQSFVRDTFAQTFRDFLVYTLGYEDPTGTTTLTLTLAYWYGNSVSASFTISGPEKANFENKLTRESFSSMATGGYGGTATFVLSIPPVVEEKSNLWIIGVVVASLMAVLILILLVKYVRNYKGVDADEKGPLV